MDTNLTQQHTLTLVDGRVMAYRTAGPRHGKPLLFFHGTPGTSLQADLIAEQAVAEGFFLIAPDRPGLGASSFQEDRQWHDYTQDIRQLISALDIHHFVLVGISGGGPYAIACAAAMPEYIIRTVLLSPWWFPHGAPKPFEGLTNLFKVYGYLAQRSPALTKTIAKTAAWVAQHSPDHVIDHLVSQLNADDQALFKNPLLHALMVKDVAHAFSQGWQGPWRETLLDFLPPRIIPQRILMHLDIFHGTEDKIVPYHYAQRLVAQLPQSELHTIEGGGHFVALRITSRVFEILKS